MGLVMNGAKEDGMKKKLAKEQAVGIIFSQKCKIADLEATVKELYKTLQERDEEIKILREALLLLSNGSYSCERHGRCQAHDIARKALEEK
jgi:hypothetical protein